MEVVSFKYTFKVHIFEYTFRFLYKFQRELTLLRAKMSKNILHHLKPKY